MLKLTNEDRRSRV
jgi:hypothetical protein